MRQHDLHSKCNVIDLTHTLNAEVPTWDGSCGFKQIITGNYSDCTTPTKFQFQCFEMRAGIGTHMDAPCHCIDGGIGIAEIAMEQLVLPLIVLDVSSQAHANFQIDEGEILSFEKKHSKISPGCLVIGYTGWSRFWNDPVRYRNADEKGQVYFPSFSRKAGEMLLDRGASGICIDTLSPDLGVDGTFPNHELFLGAGKYLVENVANANLLPPIGAIGAVLPLKISKGSEAPVRFIAFK